MKHLLFLVSVLAATWSCTGATKQKPSESTSSDSTAQATVEDSADDNAVLTVDTVVKVVANDRASSTVTIHWPVSGPKAVVERLRNDILDELASAATDVTLGNMGDTTAVDRPRYTGPANDASQVAKFFAGKMQQLLLRDVDDVAEGMQLAHDVTVEKTWESDQYVTYTTTDYIYLGGAHPSTTFSGRTVDRKTGQHVKLKVDKSKANTPALQAIMRKGLTSYFNENGGMNGMELDDLLFLEDPNAIPLPATALWINEKGVVFLYQPYEIGPYAIGAPEFAVPLDELKPYLVKK